MTQFKLNVVTEYDYVNYVIRFKICFLTLTKPVKLIILYNGHFIL